MDRSNVTNLRPIPNAPYDHQTEEPGTPVVLTELAWSLVVQVLRNNPLPAMRECGEQITAQIRVHQARRIHPSTRDRQTARCEEIRGWDEAGR